MKQIYLDNAATTPLAKEVAEAMIPVLTDVLGIRLQVTRLVGKLRL